MSLAELLKCSAILSSLSRRNVLILSKVPAALKPTLGRDKVFLQSLFPSPTFKFSFPRQIGLILFWAAFPSLLSPMFQFVSTNIQIIFLSLDETLKRIKERDILRDRKRPLKHIHETFKFFALMIVILIELKHYESTLGFFLAGLIT